MERLIVGSETELGLILKKPRYTDLALLNMKGDRPLSQIYPLDYLSKELFEVSDQTAVFGISAKKGKTQSSCVQFFNGGICYIDVGRPEIATPECTTLDQIVAYEQAERLAVNALLRWLRLAEGIECLAFANNTDHRLIAGHQVNTIGNHLNTIGYHLNIGMSEGSRVDYDPIYHFLATAQLFTGNGVVLPESAEKQGFQNWYAISQRALSITFDFGILTTGLRVALITADKDERLALHITSFDTNISPYCTKLKVGTTSLVQRLIEQGWQPRLGNPSKLRIHQNFHQIASKESGWLYHLEDRTIPAVDIQRVYLAAAEKKFGNCEDPDIRWTLREWSLILNQLESDPMAVTSDIDWINKKRLVDNFDATGKRRADLIRIDLSYHVLDPKLSTYVLAYGDWTNNPQVDYARFNPPTTTRAYGRGIVARGLAKVVGGYQKLEPAVFDWDMVEYLKKRLSMPNPEYTYEDEADSFLRSIA